MLFDLDTAKQRLAIEPTDPAHDLKITALLKATQLVAERWCNCFFDFKDFFTEPVTKKLMQLHRLPVPDLKTITVRDQKNIIGTFSASACGLVYINEYKEDFNQNMVVTYAGGYTNLPDDLIEGLFLLFEQFYFSENGEPLARVSVPDVGSLSFQKKEALFNGTIRAILTPFKIIEC